MVRAAKNIVKVGHPNDFVQPFDFKKISKAVIVVKFYCVRRLGMKTLGHCFPPKLSRQVWPEVSLPTL
jgi:hypothetical protein